MTIRQIVEEWQRDSSRSGAHLIEALEMHFKGHKTLANHSTGGDRRMKTIREVVERWKNGEETDYERMIADLENRNDTLTAYLMEPAGFVTQTSYEHALAQFIVKEADLQRQASLRIIELLESFTEV